MLRYHFSLPETDSDTHWPILSNNPMPAHKKQFLTDLLWLLSVKYCRMQTFRWLCRLSPFFFVALKIAVASGSTANFLSAVLEQQRKIDSEISGKKPDIVSGLIKYTVSDWSTAWHTCWYRHLHFWRYWQHFLILISASEQLRLWY